MSPGSVTTGQTDKPAEYAAAGIRHYWRIEHDPAQSTLSVFCYRLDPTTAAYASAGVHTGRKDDRHRPVSITIDLTTLLNGVALSTRTRIRCDIGHYAHRVAPGHHIVGRSSKPKSKAIDHTALTGRPPEPGNRNQTSRASNAS